MIVPRIGEIKDLTDKTETLLSISEDATVAEAAANMSAHHIGCLAVLGSRGQFVGIVSERDMLSKVLAKSLGPHEVRVKKIMTPSVVCCSGQTTINQAEALMAKHKIRHLPILDGDKPISMISSRDLIAYRLKSNKAMQMAAEQLAMLPAGLKSLELEDVIDLAINEVPKSFGAERAVLCLPRNGSAGPSIHRNQCECSHKELTCLLESDEIPQSVQIDASDVCSGCKGPNKQLFRTIIPLSIQEHSNEKTGIESAPALLCMCHSKDPATRPEESRVYKASLLQQVLSSSLTNAKLYKHYRDARRDSETDPLTGVGTRRVLENVLKAECARSKRYLRRFSLAIVDLDKFKEINDTAGHAAGDQALKQLAKLMRRNIRETDIIITRYGGDEFVLVMPETTLTGGKVLLERIRRQLKNISIAGIQTPTVSCGLTEWNPSPPDSPATIMDRTDAALYEAKRNGRDRVIAHPPTPVTV